MILEQKLQCSSRDIIVPDMLIHQKKNSFLVAPPNSLDGTVGVSSVSKLISETAETMTQQSVLLGLEKQKAKLAMDQQKEKTNSNKVKSPVKRKSKFTNRSFRENDKKRNRFDNFGEDEKEQLKKVGNKKKRTTKEKKKGVITSMIVKKTVKKI